jgi:hypothetical protein
MDADRTQMETTLRVGIRALAVWSADGNQGSDGDRSQKSLVRRWTPKDADGNERSDAEQSQGSLVRRWTPKDADERHDSEED